MPYSTVKRGKRLFSITVTLLIAAGVNALPAEVSGATALPAQNSFDPNAFSPHIFVSFPLYKVDTALLNSRDLPVAVNRGKDGVRHGGRDSKEGGVSGFIRRERNGDIIIAIPTVEREKYKIRFFDDDDHFLFEVRQIRDPMLIVEKYNFQHTGMFQYELYRENLLIERSTFLIRKD